VHVGAGRPGRPPATPKINPLLRLLGLGYCLAQAYDLLATAPVNPADTEKLTFPLNGKRQRLRLANF
jgi:serine/threonine-protein kinase HipA